MTVGELERRMNPSELADWKLYDQFGRGR